MSSINFNIFYAQFKFSFDISNYVCYTKCIGGENVETINSRIAQVIDTQCRGNKSAFARELGITPAYAAQLYSGQREPSDRTISDICRIFAIRDEWLRTGRGEMQPPMTKEEEIAQLVNGAINGSSEFKRAVIKMICSRTDSELEALEAALRSVYESL